MLKVYTFKKITKKGLLLNKMFDLYESNINELVVNRPSVARAILETALSLINSVSQGSHPKKKSASVWIFSKRP